MTAYNLTISSVLGFAMTLSRRFLCPVAVIFAVAGFILAVGFQAQPAMAEANDYAVGDMVIGNPHAPVTIIEYASFTCPHCATFHVNTLPELKKVWLDSGKAKLIFRDFPFDQWALRAAMLARCAGPKRYFAFVDVLFKQQRTWARANDPLAALARIARLGGIGKIQFDACMNDRALSDSVLKSRIEGAEKFDVNSTPTLIINGKKSAGALSFEEMDRLLKQASP